MKKSAITFLWIVFLLILGSTLFAEKFMHPHALFEIDGTKWFYAWYGFATCAGIIVLSKILGFFLRRGEDYYDEK